MKTHEAASLQNIKAEFCAFLFGEIFPGKKGGFLCTKGKLSSRCMEVYNICTYVSRNNQEIIKNTPMKRKCSSQRCYTLKKTSIVRGILWWMHCIWSREISFDEVFIRLSQLLMMYANILRSISLSSLSLFLTVRPRGRGMIVQNGYSK